MPTSLEQIEEQARALSAEDRAKLAEALLETLHSPISDIEKAWAEESSSASRRSIAERFRRIPPRMCSPTHAASHDEAREFLAPARREFLAEVAYYHMQEPGQGASLAAAVEAATARALAFPLSGARAFKNARRVLVRDFPALAVRRQS